MVNEELQNNLKDLLEIRRCMDRYYPIGQEYLHQYMIWERYDKAERWWAPKNKYKYIGIVLICGFMLFITLGIIIAIAIFLFYDIISREKKRQADQQQDKLNELMDEYRKEYGPVAEKCNRLLFSKEEYMTPEALDYLIEIIRRGRVRSMNEAYDKLDEQLHRWTMEDMQNKQYEAQLEQIRKLDELISIEVWRSF